MDNIRFYAWFKDAQKLQAHLNRVNLIFTTVEKKTCLIYHAERHVILLAIVSFFVYCNQFILGIRYLACRIVQWVKTLSSSREQRTRAKWQTSTGLPIFNRFFTPWAQVGL